MLNAENVKNIAVFVSGGGTNLQALIDAQERGEIRNGRIVFVLASNEKVIDIKGKIFCLCL